MGWEESLFSVFDDLEQQAEGLHLLERDAEVADLSAAEYAAVSTAARLHASVGADLRVRLLGGRVLFGRLSRVGEDWVLLTDEASPRATQWVVRHAGIATVSGLSSRADSEHAWSAVDRLSLRSVLRRLASVAEPCLVHLADDHQVDGRLGRVGKDFFELYVGQGAGRTAHLVPVAAVVALQGRS